MQEINYFAFAITSILFLVGVAGCIIPILPGTPFILAGIIVYKLWVPEAYGWGLVGLAAILTVIVELSDYLCSYFGAKKFGGTTRGAVGAVIGALIGPFVLTPLAGLILGPLIGAIVGELSAGRTFSDSGRAGMGTLVGGLVSFLFGICASVFMIGWFVLRVFQIL